MVCSILLMTSNVFDDGMVVYLNGQEVWRNNITNATITYTTLGLTNVSGNGESAYYGATFDNMTAALEQVRSQLEAGPLGDPPELWEQLCPQLAANRWAQCALDMAAHDLWGKKKIRAWMKAQGLLG